MCFPTPVAQVSPVHPAGYAVEDSYKQVQSSWTTPDGVVHTPEENTTKSPTTKTKTPHGAAMRSGVNVRM